MAAQPTAPIYLTHVPSKEFALSYTDQVGNLWCTISTRGWGRQDEGEPTLTCARCGLKRWGGYYRTHDSAMVCVEGVTVVYPDSDLEYPGCEDRRLPARPKGPQLHSLLWAVAEYVLWGGRGWGTRRAGIAAAFRVREATAGRWLGLLRAELGLPLEQRRGVYRLAVTLHPQRAYAGCGRMRYGLTGPSPS